jgi:hypothetical protein
MNINPAAAASVAGTARAAARGGEADNQATESTRQQAKVDRPAGASGESTVHAGEHTEDRDADGRQLYDTFQRSEQNDQQAEMTDSESENHSRRSANTDGVGSKLDLEG